MSAIRTMSADFMFRFVYAESVFFAGPPLAGVPGNGPATRADPTKFSLIGQKIAACGAGARVSQTVSKHDTWGGRPMPLRLP